MAKLILIAKKRKMTCDHWSRVLTEAGFETGSCWTTFDDALQQVRESKPDLLLIETDFAN